MANLETSYMGLKLKNPIIIGSCGLTNSVENVKEAAANGAAAVVLKSLFEEEIQHSLNPAANREAQQNYYAEAESYIHEYSNTHDIHSYLQLIKDCKKAVDIPIIASINCMSPTEWTDFAKEIEAAGADALELNIFILPSDPHLSGEHNEQVYFEIAKQMVRTVKIPVAVKISYYFSGLAKMAMQLSWTGISGLVLFNRFFSPDIDIEKFEIKSSNVFSSPAELSLSLRWVAMLSSKVQCDIAASTGIHDGKAVIKQLLAGAQAVQIVSVIYKKGFKQIGLMLNELDNWMIRHKFETTNQFIGKMSVQKTDNPAAYERVQFMRYFAGIE